MKALTLKASEAQSSVASEDEAPTDLQRLRTGAALGWIPLALSQAGPACAPAAGVQLGANRLAECQSVTTGLALVRSFRGDYKMIAEQEEQ